MKTITMFANQIADFFGHNLEAKAIQAAKRNNKVRMQRMRKRLIELQPC